MRWVGESSWFLLVVRSGHAHFDSFAACADGPHGAGRACTRASKLIHCRSRIVLVDTIVKIPHCVRHFSTAVSAYVPRHCALGSTPCRILPPPAWSSSSSAFDPDFSFGFKTICFWSSSSTSYLPNRRVERSSCVDASSLHVMPTRPATTYDLAIAGTWACGVEQQHGQQRATYAKHPDLASQLPALRHPDKRATYGLK